MHSTEDSHELFKGIIGGLKIQLLWYLKGFYSLYSIILFDLHTFHQRLMQFNNMTNIQKIIVP